MEVINEYEHMPYFCLFNQDTEVNHMLISNNKVFTFHKSAYGAHNNKSVYIFVKELDKWINKDQITVMLSFFPN